MPTQQPANPRHIELSAPVELAATAGQALPAQFSGVAYSGGLVPSYGVVIDVASTEVPARMPLLMEHARDNIIGVVEATERQASRILVAGKLFSDLAGSDAERVAQLSSRGAPYQMSVGLYGYSEDYVPAGMTAKVNGAEFAGPLVVLRGGKVREVSIVTLGADPQTSAHVFSLPDGSTAGSPSPSAAHGAPSSSMTLEQLTARVAELTATVSTLTTERDAALSENRTLKEAAAAVAKAQREADVTALFAELGQTPSAEQRAAFTAMGAPEFGVAASMLRATAQQLAARGGALFTETITEAPKGQQQGTPAAKTLNASDIFSRRRALATA